MIIDMHTHIWADKIADRALKALKDPFSLNAFTNGTAASLREQTTKSGVDLSVILPVVTKPSQTSVVNQGAIACNHTETHLHSFGGIHPENEDYKDILKNLKAEGIKGIKLHPVFQGLPFDDMKFLHIMDYASQLDLIISVHGGRDINSPNCDFTDVFRIRNVLKQLNPPKLILAHMAGLFDWENALPLLEEYKPFVDTSFALPSPIESENPPNMDFLNSFLFCDLVHATGASHVLFGTDSPWASHCSSIRAIRESGLSEDEIRMILGDNAKRLLGL